MRCTILNHGLRIFGIACGLLIIMLLPSAGETAAPAATTHMVKPGGFASDTQSGQSSTAPAAGAKPVEIAAPANAGLAGDEFDRGAALKALKAAADAARSCKQPDGPTGVGRMTVTFEPSGEVKNTLIDGPPFAGTVVGKCVARAFRAAKVPPFRGSPVTVAKSFSIN